VPNLKDTDFLYLTALVREKENWLVSAEQLDRIIRTDSDLDVAKILEECGYEQVEVSDAARLDRALGQKMTVVLQEIAARVPDMRMVDMFRVKYDYHNAKVLIKAEAADVDGDRLMSDGGRVARAVFEEDYYEGLFDSAPPILAKAILAARQVLKETKDAQAADMILDRAMYQEYLDLAEVLGDAFFSGYIRLSIDGVNLRTAVRVVRMGMGPDKLIDALIPGGTVSPERVIRAANMKQLYIGTPLAAAAQLASDVMEGGALTAFEREIDNARSVYMKQARFIAFGLAPVLAYLVALEAEAEALRIVMVGRNAGLEPEAIRERLRD